MSINKYRVRATCLSCGKRVKGPTVAVISTVKEDGHQTKVYLLHESCQSNMLLEIPFADEEVAPPPQTPRNRLGWAHAPPQRINPVMAMSRLIRHDST